MSLPSNFSSTADFARLYLQIAAYKLPPYNPPSMQIYSFSTLSRNGESKREGAFTFGESNEISPRKRRVYIEDKERRHSHFSTQFPRTFVSEESRVSRRHRLTEFCSIISHFSMARDDPVKIVQSKSAKVLLHASWKVESASSLPRLTPICFKGFKPFSSVFKSAGIWMKIENEF